MTYVPKYLNVVVIGIGHDWATGCVSLPSNSIKADFARLILSLEYIPNSVMVSIAACEEDIVSHSSSRVLSALSSESQLFMGWI